MKKIAKFFKVSETEYLKNGDKVSYDGVILPCRATAGSAGYDFFSPKGYKIAAGETVKIPTGVWVKIENGWVLQIFPRSSLGFKYRLTLNNTVGIIDADYYNADNEGPHEVTHLIIVLHGQLRHAAPYEAHFEMIEGNVGDSVSFHNLLRQ